MSTEDHPQSDDRWRDRPPLPEMPEGWRMERPVGALHRAAETVEYEVFLESGLCRESQHNRVEEFDPWRDISSFAAVVSDEDEIQGVVRLMFGRFEELQVGLFERDEPWPPDPLLEFGSLAVRREARKTWTMGWLFRYVWQEAARLGAGGPVAVTEEWTVDLVNDTFPVGLRKLGAGKEYMGGECFAVGVTLEGMLDRSNSWPDWFHWGTDTIDLREVADDTVRELVIDLREKMPDRS
ncbi:MAG: hypothetical protein ACR2OH_02245 [Microthrixaceae bacterium]